MNLLNVISKNRKALLILILFCIFPAFALANDVLGNFLGGLASISGMALDVAKGVIGAVLSFISGLSVQLLDLGLGFLQWTSSGDFINKGMTSSMDNPMISKGWTTVRNIANILLVFGLVAVAISIMLEYQETKAKKMLINFVLMALLINFTPVICDTIIDIANSLMRVFLKGGVSPDLSDELKNKIDSGKIENIITNAVLTGFCILSFFVYLLYGILFMFRYIQLWLLIIISPIAFASKVFLPTEASRYMSYILPDQCQWEAWWKDFLNWTFIGVPAAFTIYLSNELMAIIHNNASTIVSAPGGALEGTFSIIMCYMLPLGVLIQGFIMTMNKGNTAVFNMGGWLQRRFDNTKRRLVDKPLGKIGDRLKQGGKHTLDVAKGSFSGGVGGLKDTVSNYKSGRDDSRAAGKSWNRLRGVYNATAGVVGGAVGGGGNAIEGRRIEKEVEEANEKKEKANKDYSTFQKTSTETLKRVISNGNVSTEDAANKYSAAIRVLGDRGEKLHETDQKFILANKKHLTSDAKISIASNDAKLGAQLLDENDRETANTILANMAKNNKLEEVRTFIEKHPWVVNQKTQDAIIASNASYKNLFISATDRRGRSDAEITRSTAQGNKQSKAAQITNANIGEHTVQTKNGKLVSRAFNDLSEKDEKTLINYNNRFLTAQADHNTLSKRPTPLSDADKAKLEEAKRIMEEFTQTNEIARLRGIIADPATTPEVRKNTKETLDKLTTFLAARERKIRSLT